MIYVTENADYKCCKTFEISDGKISHVAVNTNETFAFIVIEHNKVYKLDLDTFKLIGKGKPLELKKHISNIDRIFNLKDTSNNREFLYVVGTSD